VDGTVKAVYHQGMQCGEEIQYSDTLLIFLMKAHDPDKYGDKRTLQGPGGGPIAHEIDLLEQRKAEDAEIKKWESELAASTAEAQGDDDGDK
jgi:hypothetical protein